MGGGSEYPQRHSQRSSEARGNETKIPDRESFLRGVVDMGSNGIRFSVSDLSPPTSRILPTVHVHRLDISLLDAQFDPKTGSKVPIPHAVIDEVIAALLRFQIICLDLGVPDNNIRIIATEATRTAINSDEFRKAVKAATGLTVEMLAKEDEGRIGALGIASSFSKMEGLVMDLGGGSTQITWMIVDGGGIRTSPKGSFSFPYGAAALTRRLKDITHGKGKHEAEKAKDELREEMRANFLDAYEKLEIPEELVEKAKKHDGFPLYLSGGGFRGWGYLLLYQSQVHGHHYPISLINGFSAQKEDFENTEHLKEVARDANKIFRVSDRRRSQVPAVAFLINVLAKALPHGIKEAHFCQGGVREGILFQELTPAIRLQSPLEVATEPYARLSTTAISNLILSSIPEPSPTDENKAFPESFGAHVIRAFSNVLYVHSVMSKETASTAALYSSSTGLLATSHGVSHSDRALVALLLEERYQGVLPPREVDFKRNLSRLLTPEELWWTRYLGKIGFLVSQVYPAGFIDHFKPRMRLSAEWASNLGKKGKKEGLALKITVQKVEHDPFKLVETLTGERGMIEKVGKRKNWIGGRDGWGMAVRITVEEEKEKT